METLKHLYHYANKNVLVKPLFKLHYLYFNYHLLAKKIVQFMEDLAVFTALSKISAQPHTKLCIQFLTRENNAKNNTFPLGKQIWITLV